jgi:hypothetical protein
MPAWIVHLPHASTLIPAAARPDLLLSDAALAEEVLRMTDHLTDELVAASLPAAPRVIFPVNRLVVDLERFPDDAREPMSRVGMGVIYERTSQRPPAPQPAHSGRSPAPAGDALRAASCGARARGGGGTRAIRPLHDPRRAQLSVPSLALRARSGAASPISMRPRSVRTARIPRQEDLNSRGACSSRATSRALEQLFCFCRDICRGGCFRRS